MSKLVYINSIPRETVSKVSEFRNIGQNGAAGKKLNKTKLFDLCKDGFQALYSPTVGGLKTGLYKKYTDESGKETTLQEYAENKWGLPKGFLTNRSFRKGDSMKDEDLSYFQKKVWKLNDGLTVLDLDKLDDFCAYHMYLESKSIANSEKEWRTHQWPKATHYIALENESEEIKFRKNNLKSQAFAKLHSELLTLPWKRKFVSLLDLSSSRNEMKEEAIHNLLFEMITSPQTKADGISDIEVFTRYFAKLETPDGRERLESEYLLNCLVDNNIVTEKYGTYKWLSKSLEIGNSKAEAVDFISNPKKRPQVDELEKELKLKKG